MHVTKTWCCLLLGVALLSCQRKQEFLHISSYSSYTFNALPGKVEINRQLNSYDAVIRKAMAYTGVLDSSVTIATIDTFGAFFAIKRSTLQRYFLYSPAFFDSILNATHSQYALFSVCFHELAHMFYNHPLKPSRFSRIYELQADHYSGFECKVIQAGIGDATKAISIFGDWTETESHPAKAARMDEIQSGYLEACELLPPHCTDNLMKLAMIKKSHPFTTTYEKKLSEAIDMKIEAYDKLGKALHYEAANTPTVIASEIVSPFTGKYVIYGDTVVVDTYNIVRPPHEKDSVGKVGTDKLRNITLTVDGVKFYFANEILYSITPSGATLNAGYKID